MTHFERLGLPGRFDVDPAALERAYLLKSRDVHPDHHAGGMDATAAVNEAYQTLRDPLRRAEYLLALSGGVSPVTSPQDPGFLMRMMELRERIESAGDPAEVRGELSARLAALYTELAGRFAAGDVGAVGRLIGEAKTVRSLLRQMSA